MDEARRSTWHDSHSTQAIRHMRQITVAMQCFQRFASVLLIASLAALCGCIACPEGASCDHCRKSFPYDLSLSIPWIGGEDSPTECGSACEPRDGEHTTCDDVVADDDSADHAGDESLYDRVVDGLIIQTVSTVTFSTVSIAGTAFGTIANYCIPEGALGPPETVPPGRFHPVPTRPVFAARG